MTKMHNTIDTLNTTGRSDGSRGYNRNDRSVVEMKAPNLRGTLGTREQRDRDPFKYYEKVEMLGVGSMGSVCKVRKKKRYVGGTARDHNHKRRGTFEKIPLLGKIIRNASRGKKHLPSVPLPSVPGVDGSDVESEVSYSRHSNSNSHHPRRRSSRISSGRADYEVVYALKSLNLEKVKGEAYEVELKNEVDILKSLDHPYIVKAIEVFEFKRNMYIVEELCSGGDLYTRDPYIEEEAARIVRMILSALRHMHENNIMHRDLKYENVMFASDNPISEVKLIDFGLSKKYGKDEIQNEGVGTIYTMAPEVLRGKYDERADIWSVGVIAYMLLSSQMPFYGTKRSEVARKIREGEYAFKGRRWKNVSRQAQAFVTDLLQVDPEDRPTAAEARQSLWLNKSLAVTQKCPDSDETEKVFDAMQRFANYSMLQKLGLMVVAHKSTSEEIGHLRKVFQRFSKGHDEKTGAITKSQFQAALESYGYSEEDIDDIFRKLDIDGSGYIHYTEFLAATLEALGPINEERIAEGFDRLDTDSSGCITAENLVSILGDGLSEAAIQKIITEADMNADSKISYDEFLSLWDDIPTKPESEASSKMTKPPEMTLSGHSRASDGSLFGSKTRGESAGKPIAWDAEDKWGAPNAWEEAGMF